MLNHLRPAIVLTLAMTVLTGLAYPLAITGAAQVLMPGAANGSLIERDGTPAGSLYIGQAFSDPRHFWSRPSATPDAPYNAGASSGSNLGTTSAALKARVEAEAARLTASGLTAPLPADALMASGSGLDPHISPAFALAQVPRVAQARSIAEAKVRTLLREHTEEPLLGLFGEPRVNVLALNLALDSLKE
ncbi:MAG: potassium-transporting ATPase subunit KdpC [Pannonibacter phragmitetus]